MLLSTPHVGTGGCSRSIENRIKKNDTSDIFHDRKQVGNKFILPQLQLRLVCKSWLRVIEDLYQNRPLVMFNGYLTCERTCCVGIKGELGSEIFENRHESPFSLGFSMSFDPTHYDPTKKISILRNPFLKRGVVVYEWIKFGNLQLNTKCIDMLRKYESQIWYCDLVFLVSSSRA